MCLMIHKPKGIKIPEEILKSAFLKNKDGWGLMRKSSKGGVYVEKDITGFDKFLEIYKDRFEDHECAIHFRKATSGKVSKNQAHPYKINDNVWLMHNGTISGLPEYDKKKSDTWHFTQYIKSMVDKHWLTDKDFVSILEAVLWNGQNKALILSKDQGFMILNRELGRDYNDCWYSNTYAWDLPADLQKEIDKEKAQKATVTYYGGWEKTWSTETETGLAAFFATKIYNKELSEDILDEETTHVRSLVLKNLIAMDEKKEKEESSSKEENEEDIPKELRIFDNGKLDEEDNCIAITEGIPVKPENIIELSNMSLQELREATYHYPDEIAEFAFELMNGR